MALRTLLKTIQDKVPILQVFMQKNPSGQRAPQKHQVRARTAEYYLRLVAQKLLRVGSDNPRFNSAGKTDYLLQQMIKSWKKR